MSFIVFVLLLIIFAKGDKRFGCSTNSAIVGTGITVCHNYGDHENCTIQVGILGTVDDVGYTDCYTFINPFTNNTMFDARVTYLNYTMLVLVDRQYSTSDWFGWSETNSICAGLPGCGNDAQCATWNIDDPTGNGFLTDDYTINYWGDTNCQTSFGTPHCYPCDNPVCAYSRETQIPFAPFYNVSFPTRIIHQTSLLFEIYDSVGNFQFGVIEGVGNVNLNIGDFKLAGNVVGNFNPNIEFFFPESANCLVQNVDDPDLSFISNCAPLNSQQVNRIGDIQGADPQALKSPTHNTSNGWSYVGAPGMYTLTPPAGCSSVGYSWITPGVKNLQQAKLLPAYISGVHFTNIYDSNGYPSLIGTTSNGGAVQYHLDIPGGYSVITKIDVVCPTFAVGYVPIVSGCFGCLTDATVTIIAYSHCAAGYVEVYMNGSTTITLSVNLVSSLNTSFNVNSLVPIVIRFYSAVASVNATLCLVGLDEKACINFGGELESDIIIINKNHTMSNNTNDNNNNGISDFFNGIGDWISDLYTNPLGIFGSIILDIIALAVIIGIVMLICSCCTHTAPIALTKSVVNHVFSKPKYKRVGRRNDVEMN